MARIIENDQGQWILLSGLVIAIALVLLVTLMNNAAVTGYHSSSNALEFPKDDIRSLVSESRDATSQAVHIAHQINQSSNKTVPEITTSIIEDFNRQTSLLYASHGQTVDISVSNITTNDSTSSFGDIVWLNISYNDGNTFYSSEPEIVEVSV
ncbi:hypothetical protein HNV12_09745 [Methanococcoides sp. SA1]|nr:hypothetical protein [Methanococcoides sp. SA1]